MHKHKFSSEKPAILTIQKFNEMHRLSGSGYFWCIMFTCKLVKIKTFKNIQKLVTSKRSVCKQRYTKMQHEYMTLTGHRVKNMKSRGLHLPSTSLGHLHSKRLLPWQLSLQLGVTRHGRFSGVV